ncbi:MAG: hypothetical protein PHE15_00125 [Dehalococcoidales bacterium]|nr:hypothetical protein [Dehalococcoidales bacterium]
MVEFYRPYQVKYLRDDIIWVIANVLPLEAGEWPSEPAENCGGHKVNHSAPFETPGMIRAEIEYRLKLTKEDGETLVWEIQVGHTEDYRFLCPVAKKALNYICSGVKRRNQTYSEWLRDRKTKQVTNKLGNLVDITTSKCVIT